MAEKRKLIYTDSEMSLIKNTFKDDEPLLFAIRKLMLQLPLNESDMENLKRIKNEGTLAVLRKAFLPTLDGEAPVGQIIDLWMTVDVGNKDECEVYNVVMARQLLIDYIDQQLVYLETGKKGAIIFKELTNMEHKEGQQIFINLKARNTMIGHTAQRLGELVALANRVEETKEQKEERERKDSSK